MDVDVAYLKADSWDDRMPDRLRWLRENDPVHWSEQDQLWVISKFEDVNYVSKNQQIFTSGQGVRPGMNVKLGLIDEEEPHHGEVRKLINRGFTPRMVKKLEVVFRRLATEAIDAIADQGQCEFVEAIAVPLPLLVIAEMIGIRKEDRARFHAWSDAMIAGDGNLDHPEIVQKAGRAYVEYTAYVSEIIEDRRKHPRDDLVSLLVGAKDDGFLLEFDAPETDDRIEGVPDLANDELIKILVVLLVAGNETTRNGISGGMELLIDNPAERQKLIDDPSLIPGAVEEMVRLVSPVHSFGRTVLADTELRGKQLEKGQTVLLVYPSANRDADVFEQPDRFQIDRNASHLGFGVGTHFCLGANLARMEMRVAFEELLRRLPDMEYASGGPVIKPSALVRTCARMDVRYTPERRASRARPEPSARAS
jgi:cytochrome P450 family 142 subfamily A polypeptide 1